MQIILKKDVANLGHADDVVTVKSGYARNYLIPQGFAVAATPSALKMHAETLRQRAHKEAKKVADAEALAASINAVLVKVAAKVSEAGKIYGSVTTAQLAEAPACDADAKAIYRSEEMHEELFPDEISAAKTGEVVLSKHVDSDGKAFIFAIYRYEDGAFLVYEVREATVVTILGNNPVNDYCKGTCRAADLNAASAKCRNTKACNDCGKKSRSRIHARSNGKCDCKWKGNNADDYAGDEVAHKSL